MTSPFKVRYVLVSDYATVDRGGKLVIAGLYTEDLVVPSLPTLIGSLVFTVLAEPPKEKRKFRFEVESPSGLIVLGADGEIEPIPNRDGARARAILGFQFGQAVFNEAGEFKVFLSTPDRTERSEIHRFRLIIDPNAGVDSPVQPTPEASPTPEHKSIRRRKAL
jgi:hypothetical protein